MGQHELQVDPVPDKFGEHISINVLYPAVSWPCPESITVEFDVETIATISTVSLEKLFAALARIPVVTRTEPGDPDETDEPVMVRYGTPPGGAIQRGGL